MRQPLLYTKGDGTMPCTTLLVGKNATVDGSTMMARNEDSPSGKFTFKKFIVVRPEDQPRKYKSVISQVEIALPDNPLRYTAMPNAQAVEGIWGEAGINAANVAMTETETITSNPRVLGADPLVPGGIGEEDLLTLVLPYIRSAREGVLRLGSLLEQYGTYEMNGIGFQDVDEVWWLESIGGHHWIAKRVPDDEAVVMPNQQGIDFLDLADALGAGKDNLCSRDLAAFIEENHLDLTLAEDREGPVAEDTAFDCRSAFGSHDDADHTYNTPRAWYMLRCLIPFSIQWEGPEVPFHPEDDDLPWSVEPDRKVTVEDVKYILSSHYQGTPYDPYGHKGDGSLRGGGNTGLSVSTGPISWPSPNCGRICRKTGGRWNGSPKGATCSMPLCHFIPMWTKLRNIWRLQEKNRIPISSIGLTDSSEPWPMPISVPAPI